MDFIIISAAALLASGLTLYSGFGLGTLLLPVFALLFPVNIAIALTAIVHFLNNIFKLFLLAKFADFKVVAVFGIPAIIAAFFGAEVLDYLSDAQPIATYKLLGRIYYIELIKAVVAFLILIFAVLELIPNLEKKYSFKRKYLPLGGLLSGFFGGLSGHQGALRSAFLIRLNLTKETFIATGIVVALMIDTTRLLVYSTNFLSSETINNFWLLFTSTVSAFIGAFLARRLLNKVSYKFIHILVGIMLIFIALGLGSGIF
jgi:uncharacterized membrane protein YfcA